jgi:LysR family transcriptional regulator, hydrogen peroxide-inducible genes activator
MIRYSDRMLTLRQLRYFSALAATGHFGRAAELAGISQPALSMQLKEMEAELRGPLVERTSSGATLTELGRQVAERSGRILSAMRDLEELPRASGAVLAGPLRLGIIPSVAPYLLPGLLDATRRSYPELQLLVRETVTATLTSELTDGGLDAIVASLPLGVDDLAEAPAFKDRFLLAAPATSPHSKRSPALAELIDADELLLLEDGHCLRDQALAVCRAIDPRRLRSFGATSLATVLQLVAAGQGITLAPELALAAGAVSDERLRVVNFAEPQPFRTIGVAWRRSSPRERDYRALAELMSECRPIVGTADRPRKQPHANRSRR